MGDSKAIKSLEELVKPVNDEISPHHFRRPTADGTKTLLHRNSFL